MKTTKRLIHFVEHAALMCFFLLYSITDTLAQEPNLWLEGHITTDTVLNDGFEDVNLPPFTSGGDAIWFVQSATKHSGNYAAQSGPIGHNQSTYIKYIYTGTEPAELSFWAKVSSEPNHDQLIVSINSNQVLTLSGQRNWKQYKFTLEGGADAILWTYNKDGNISMGSDVSWLDDLLIITQSGKVIRISDGTEGWGKVLVSDASGKAKWESVNKAITLSQNLPIVASHSQGFGFFASENYSGIYSSDNDDNGLTAVGNGGNGVRSTGNTRNGLICVGNDEDGVHSSANNAYGLHSNYNGGDGVYSENNAGAGINASNNQGAGLYAYNNAGDGVYIHSSGGYGVFAYGNDTIGIYSGYNAHDGVVSNNNVDDGIFSGWNGDDGMLAYANVGDGLVASWNDIGINANNNDSHGVATFSNDGDGIYSIGNSGDEGYFSGSVTITGQLTKPGGSFKIDHPLDPQNKYLYHSFVESPEMMNVYNGNVILDGEGEATITMPDWFEVLNRDFRYQLTALGAPGPNLYISEKMNGGQFKISGGSAGMEVSWQVTGIRQDPYANKHRIQVEEEKEDKFKGYYLQPDAYDMPFEKSHDYVKLGHKTLEELKAEHSRSEGEKGDR